MVRMPFAIALLCLSATAFAKVEKLSRGLERMGFSLTRYDDEWVLGVPMLGVPRFSATLNSTGEKGYFTRLDSATDGATVLVTVENSVGEKAEFRIDESTYRMTYRYSGPPGEENKTVQSWYIRSPSMDLKIRAMSRYYDDRNLSLVRYDRPAKALIVRSVATGEEMRFPLILSERISIHFVNEAFAFFESKNGCPLIRENMGGLLEDPNHSFVMINLSKFLYSAESMAETRYALWDSDRMGSGFRGTVQQIVDNLNKAQAACEDGASN